VPLGDTIWAWAIIFLSYRTGDPTAAKSSGPWGVDHTGLYLDEIPGMTAQIERISWSARSGRPYLSETTVSFAPNAYKRHQVLTLPFGNAPPRVERIMFVFDFQESRRAGTRGSHAWLGPHTGPRRTP